MAGLTASALQSLVQSLFQGGPTPLASPFLTPQQAAYNQYLANQQKLAAAASTAQTGTEMSTGTTARFNAANLNLAGANAARADANAAAQQSAIDALNQQNADLSQFNKGAQSTSGGTSNPPNSFSNQGDSTFGGTTGGVGSTGTGGIGSA